LVDNAKIEFGGEVDFRADFEAELSNNGKIPLVVLVLGGGKQCYYIFSSIEIQNLLFRR
jgi:hypothetical protein